MLNSAKCTSHVKYETGVYFQGANVHVYRGVGFDRDPVMPSPPLAQPANSTSLPSLVFLHTNSSLFKQCDIVICACACQCPGWSYGTQVMPQVVLVQKSFHLILWTYLPVQ